MMYSKKIISASLGILIGLQNSVSEEDCQKFLQQNKENVQNETIKEYRLNIQKNIFLITKELEKENYREVRNISSRLIKEDLTKEEKESISNLIKYLPKDQKPLFERINNRGLVNIINSTYKKWNIDIDSFTSEELIDFAYIIAKRIGIDNVFENNNIGNEGVLYNLLEDLCLEDKSIYLIAETTIESIEKKRKLAEENKKEIAYHDLKMMEYSLKTRQKFLLRQEEKARDKIKTKNLKAGR